MFARNRLITFKIALDTCPSSKYSDNSFPVVLQITYKRKVFRKRSGFRSIPENWDNERFVSDKRKVRNYKERNDDLNFLEDKVLSKVTPFEIATNSSIGKCKGRDEEMIEYLLWESEK